MVSVTLCTDKELMFACPKNTVHAVKIVGIVSQRLIVRPSLCICVPHRTCICTSLVVYACFTRNCECVDVLQHPIGLAQAISASGTVVSSALHNLPIKPCPDVNVIKESHLRGIPRAGPRPQIHIPVGARGPLVVTISHEWDEDASRGSPSARGVQPETWAMRRSRS